MQEICPDPGCTMHYGNEWVVGDCGHGQRAPLRKCDDCGREVCWRCWFGCFGIGICRECRGWRLGRLDAALIAAGEER
jgi:hypothetical protein